MGALMQCNKNEIVLTPAECSAYYGANVTERRKTLKYDFKFHALHATISLSNYSTWF